MLKHFFTDSLFIETRKDKIREKGRLILLVVSEFCRLLYGTSCITLLKLRNSKFDDPVIVKQKSKTG